ncbi:MAG: signal peptidase I [Myxococcales bacterium]|nr:signal peptidase I [Myxococcales bacterium]
MRCSKLYVNGEAIPQLRQDGVCEFYDTSEFGRDDCMRVSDSWSRCPCTRYREKLGDVVYDTNYDAGRLDAPTEPYISLSSDFPALPHAAPAASTPARFQCTEQRKGVDVVTKDRGVIGTYEPAAQVSEDPCGPRYHYKVPPGHVFAMGDNRDHSNDSRFWGPVPFAAIKGKAIFVFWSRGEPSGLRLERFGQFIH